MILGIGIDIVEVQRLRKERVTEGFLERILHPDEFHYILTSREDPASSAAARFAAKEAFGKALGTGIRGFSLKDVKVSHDREGKPLLVLEGRARDLFEQRGGVHMHLSLSHEHHYACAVVVIEGAS